MGSILGDIETDRIGSKEDRNKTAMEAEDHRKMKLEHKQMRENGNRLKGIDTCEFLVHPVLNLAWITLITSK